LLQPDLAPSLHQIYFNNTSTQFAGGFAVQVATFNNDQKRAIPAKLFGIPQLKQEESQSASIGFTAKIRRQKLTFTADAYSIYIKDRVVLTDQFARPVGAQTPGSTGATLQGIF
jgi:iron complex outermembrane receptor protein